MRKPQPDDSLRSIVEEIHNILTQPGHRVRVSSNATPFVPALLSSSPDIAAYSMGPSSIGGSFGMPAKHAGHFGSANLVMSTLPIRSSTESVKVMSVPTETPFPKRQWVQKIPSRQPNAVGQEGTSLATNDLNASRRAIGAREYEDFKQQHNPPKQVQKPSFLELTAPTIHGLQDCIPYIFASSPDGKQQTHELKSEMERWMQGFSHFVRNNKPDAVSDTGLLALLATLNGAIEKSAISVRRLFYDMSDSAGLFTTLDQILAVSKSVRVMKEIEEFQDARQEWEDDRRGN